MSTIFRTVAYAAWGLAFGLSIWLAVEFHEYKFGISLGVAVLALILSAFGLILARWNAQQKDGLGTVIGIVLWLAGAVSFGITEMGYWSSSYKDRHAEYVQTKAVKARQEGLTDMAWEAVKTGQVRATAAELTSRLKAAKQSDFWSLSSGCVNATTPKSRAFCQGYFDLEARLASADKLESMEARFLSEKPVANETMVHNVFAAADLIAENSELNEKEAATVVVLIIALVLMLSRDLLLIVANPFGGARSASRTGESAGGHQTTSAVASPAPRPRLDALTKIAGVSAVDHVPDVTKMVPEQFAVSAKTPTVSTLENLPQIGSNSPNLEPDGPGTPVNLPENPDGSTEEATEPTNVVPLRSDHPTKAEMRIDRRANENSVSRWLRDNTASAGRNSKGIPAHKLIDNYASYCRQRGETPLSKRKFSTVLRGELDLPKLRGADGKRKSAVMMFPLELVQQTAKRKVA